jgi:hypothetical protein
MEKGLLLWLSGGICMLVLKLKINFEKAFQMLVYSIPTFMVTMRADQLLTL